MVTGLGAVTPLGIGHRVFWDGVLAARSTARPLDGCDAGRYPTSFACPVDDAAFDPTAYVTNPKALKLMSRATRFAVAASKLAMDDAELGAAQRDPLRAGIAHGAGGVGLHDQDYLDSMAAVSAEPPLAWARQSAPEQPPNRMRPPAPSCRPARR